MSELIVKVTTIDAINPHPNADRLDLAIVGGWQCVVGKGQFQMGDKIVYFPPDTVLPQSLSDELNVTQYLSKQRIRCARLRGEPSFGLVVKAPDGYDLDTNLADYYGVTRYQPPVKMLGEQQERDHALFPKYTDIENMRHYPHIFQDGELVSVTEKIHGTNCRVGIVQGEKMAGSHRMRRKMPAEMDADYHGVGTYWFPWSLEPVRDLLELAAKEYEQVILYGEVYGPGIQDLTYGRRDLGFRAFDLMVDGKFVSVDAFYTACGLCDVETVPELAQIPYSLEAIKALASGVTIAGDGCHIREGVVVKPINEREDPRLGRVVLKYVSDDYLLRGKDDSADI